jgi:hypothetical protein
VLWCSDFDISTVTPLHFVRVFFTQLMEYRRRNNAVRVCVCVFVRL